MTQRTFNTPVQAQIIGRIKTVKRPGIFVVHTEALNRDFTCTCDFFCPVSEDDAIHALCVVEEHPNFGKQLRITAPPFVQIAMDSASIVRCFIKLLRGTGFGTNKAEELYELFARQSGSPDNVTSYISQLAARWYETRDNKELEEYAGLGIISPSQLQRLLAWWHKQRSLRRLYLLGLNNREIESCLSYVKRPEHSGSGHEILYDQCIGNPYVIAPLSMDKCHQIMARINRQPSPQDLECGTIIRKIYEVLDKKGWVATPTRQIMSWFPQAHHQVERLKTEYRLTLEYEMGYLSYPYMVETTLARKVVDLVASTPPMPSMDSTTFLNSNLSEDQKVAIRGALHHRISIINGGAGTGKTTIIKEIVHNLNLRETPWMVTSFTGKAVARVREVLGVRGPSTMHRLIARFAQAPKFKCLIIDETSMVSASLIYEFMDKFTDDFRLILVGDPNQLRPIGWGTFFEQVIESKVVPIFKLTTNHRYCGASNSLQDGVILNALRIIDYNNGIPLQDAPNPSTNPDIPVEDHDDDYPDFEEEPSGNAGQGPNQGPFTFIPTPNFSLLAGGIDVVYDLLRLLRDHGFAAKQITVISPYNAPIKELNFGFQSIFNDNPKTVVGMDGTLWRVDDRVIMTENRYDIDVFNGDMGYIQDLNPEVVMIKFGDIVHNFKLIPSTVPPPKDNGIEDDPTGPKVELTMAIILHAYALTTHKMEGDECPMIIFYVPPHAQNSSFVDAGMVYTAITRARNAVWLVGDLEAIRCGAAKKPVMRFDNLSRRILELSASTLKE